MILISDKIYSETREEWSEKYLETYLILLRNAAGKRADARKNIL